MLGTFLMASHAVQAGNDYGKAVAVSPDDAKVFVTGKSYGGTGSGFDMATVAYTASTGGQIWVNRTKGVGDGEDHGQAITSDSSRVYVGGTVVGSTTGKDLAVYAYDIADGSLEWSYSSDGGINGLDEATAIAVGGSKVIVTGYKETSSLDFDYFTVALDAATGSVSWSQTYDGPASTVDEGHALAVDTSNVYVTGRSTQSGNHFDYATIKYALSNGAHQWTARYNGPGSDWDTAYGVVIAASMIVVTGRSRATAGGYFDYATVGYYAGNGTQKWVDRYNGPDALDDYAFGVASNSDGTSCYVTGRSYRVSSPPVPDVATVKYDCDDGDRVWVKRFTGPIAKGDGGEDIVVDSSGNVYVTGWTGALVGVGTDFLTISYASDGTQRWTHRFNGAGLNSDRAFGVAVNADATAVYVVGESWDLDDANDYVTLSIKASDGTANWSMAYNGVDGGNDILDDVPDLL